MLIDEISFGDLITALQTTASVIFADWMLTVFIVGIALALVKLGIRGVINSFNAIEGKHDDV